MKSVNPLSLLLYLLLGMFLNPSLLIAAEEPQKINLEHADTLRSRQGVRELIGHVRIRRGSTVIRSDKALHHPVNGMVTFTGNVRMTEPDRTINAELIRYNEVSGDFEASQSVVMMIGDSLKVRCQVARYNDEKQTVDLFNDVIIDDLSDMARITGNHGKWNRTDDVAVIDQDPVYMLPGKNENSKDTLVIVSELLTFYRESRSALFTGNVYLFQAEMNSQSDSLFHQPDSNRTSLTGNPVIRRGEDEVSGRNIQLIYQMDELKTLIVNGNAVALTETVEGDERRNYLSGNSLTMELINDSTRSINVDGAAQGQYYIWDEDDVYQGVNLVAADVIDILVVAKKTEKISLHGRANGTFYPPGMEPVNAGQGKNPARKTFRGDE